MRNPASYRRVYLATAASRYDRDEFHRLDVELIVGTVVKLEVLPWGGRADSPHGPDGLNSTYKKSLREIADFKEPKSALACVSKITLLE